MIDDYDRGKVIDIVCRSDLNAVSGSEVTCGSVPYHLLRDLNI